MGNTRRDSVETAGFFFGSWGALWCLCDADHPHAEAFGPDGVARRATENEASDLCPGPGTAWENAKDRGAVVDDDDGWSWLRLWDAPREKSMVETLREEVSRLKTECETLRRERDRAEDWSTKRPLPDREALGHCTIGKGW